MTVESFEFREKVGFWKVAVDDANRVVGVQGCDQLIVGFGDGFHIGLGSVHSL